MKNTLFDVSIRCHYPTGEPTQHRQTLKLTDISKWVDAYKFTHPNCRSISIKIWFDDQQSTIE